MSASTCSSCPSSSGACPPPLPCPASGQLKQSLRRSFEVLLTTVLGYPSFLPHIEHKFNDFLVFDLNYAVLYGLANWLYYFSLEPTAAVRPPPPSPSRTLIFVSRPPQQITYLPLYTLMVLSATAFGTQNPSALQIAAVTQVVSWTAQFLGHGFAERRAPALLDNLLGGASLPYHAARTDGERHTALVLAPFFVHLEWLFIFGYKPALHKDIQNGIGVEIARIRKAEGDKRRVDADQGKKDL